ncbi:MAG: DUF58 domain-containing protein [Planctomycetota bacterium]
MSSCTSRLRITTRGRLTLILLHLALGAAWLSGDPAVQLAAALLGAPVLIDLLWKLAIRPDLAIELRDRRGIARMPFTEAGYLVNRSNRAALRALHLREPRTGSQNLGGIDVPWIAPGERLAVEYSARYPRRGKHAVRVFEGDTDWPFGLFRWEIELKVDAIILAEPTRKHVAREPAGNRGVPVPATRMSSPDQEEFWALRELRFGDDARRAHAKRSAALGTMVVAVRRAAPQIDVQLIVDLRIAPDNAPSFGGRPIEHRLGQAAWLVDRWVDAGLKFSAHLIDSGWRSIEIVDRQRARQYLEWLTVARPTQYRTLDDEEVQRALAATDATWIAAGGYVEPKSSTVRPTG